jgi:hypothetical protein
VISDFTAIISFLVSLALDKNLNFLGKAVLAFLIELMCDAVDPPSPPIDSTAEYGKYLAAQELISGLIMRGQ